MVQYVYVISNLMNLSIMNIMILSLGFVSAINDDPCPISSSCSCDGFRILCDNVSFNEVPKFRKTKITFDGWNLYLGGNNITEIPSRAFINISLVFLSMAENPLKNIADDAFYGSENIVYTLILSNTHLDEVPKAIGKLTNLHVLDLQFNPIKILPNDIMKSISKTLQFISLGSSEMTEWPYAIRYLTGLHVANFYNLPMSDLPIDSFRGLEDTELILYFKAPGFVQIPKALGVLKSMKELDIVDNLKITSRIINKYSFQGMTSLRTLALDNNSLTEVPDLSELPSLTNLELTNSPVSYWDEDYVSNNSSLASVILDRTLINSVPKIVSKLNNITSLSFFGTKITNLTANDLKGLTKLQAFCLSFSPVRNISNDAFMDNKEMKSLLLDDLEIVGFPKAVKTIPHLKYLDLSNNAIECTCDGMGWLKGWSGINYTYVEGKCQNSKDQINDFLHNHVPDC